MFAVGLVVVALGLARAGDASDEFSDPDIEDFAYPVAWLQTGPVKDRMFYASSRNLLLKTGWEGSPSQAISAAKVAYEAARKRCSDDPRLDYAYGLALWRNGQRPDAIRYFDIAARLNGEGPPFLPAAQAVAWGRLLEGERELGMKQVVRVASVLNKASGAYPTRVQKEDSALFLGRAIGFLIGPGMSVQTIEADKRLHDEIAALIPVDLRPEFEAGRDQVDARYRELTALATRPAPEVEAEFQQKKEQIQQELEQSRMESQQLQVEIDADGRTQRLWVMENNRNLSQLGRNLAAVKSNYQAATLIIARLSQPGKHYEKQLIRRGTKRDKYGGQKDEYETELVERPETASERQERLDNLSHSQSQAKMLFQQGEVISNELGKLQAVRRQSNIDFPKLQAARRSQRTKLVRHQRELAFKLKQIEQDYVSPEELKSRVRTIAPYVPWDVNSERDGLLASYKITLPGLSSP